MPFKVTDVCTNRKPVCDFLLVILVPFRSYCSQFKRKTVTAFLSPPPLLEPVHLRLIGKLIVDFLFVLIELFSLGVSAEALRANTEWKAVFLKAWVSFG